VDGQRIRVNGVELFVRCFGEPVLPVLIVVHGGPTWDHSYLLPAVAQLADVAHVVVFDLRGCGRSSRTAPLGTLPASALQPDRLADDVAGLVEHLGVASADVLGFSYGGGIAMRMVDQHPARVRRLILASTTAYRDVDGAAVDADPECHRRGRLCTEVDFDDPALTGPTATDGALSRAMAVADAPRMVWRLDRLVEWHQILERVRFSSDWNEPYRTGRLRPGVPDDAPDVLRRWGRPVLILHGDREMSFPVGLARRLHAELRTSTLVEIPDAAHMAHFDNPVVWLGAIRDFLRSTAADPH
jgi:pimeloyl-ACP methyl ester carboxylesterase